MSTIPNKNYPTPPLKWAGGKRWLVPIVREVFKSFNNSNFRLVEPFAGGLAVALGTLPIRALLNDNNLHLINFYQFLQQGLIIESELLNEREFFLKQRARFNELIKEEKHTSKEAAEIFYYLNRTCFNGLCRFNSKGEFNVPFGSYKKINYQRDFSNFKDVFATWQFQAGDFEKIQTTEQDFLYIDPPYDVQFTKYSQIDFSWEDQLRLVDWVKAKTNPILLSNQATDRIIELYASAGFEYQILPAPRRIAANGSRSPANEILAFSNIDSAASSIASFQASA